MNKPDKCCNPGEYACQIPMPIKGRLQSIDFCIADLVAALNAANITTVASCCGHGKQGGSIVLDDGRELVIRQFVPEGQPDCMLCDNTGYLPGEDGEQGDFCPECHPINHDETSSKPEIRE